MLSVNHFSFRTSLHSLLHLQANIARVDIDGMDLHIPPHSGAHMPHITAPNSRIKITVAKIFCKNVNLVIENANPAKDPLSFDIQDLKLTDVRPRPAHALRRLPHQPQARRQHPRHRPLRSLAQRRSTLHLRRRSIHLHPRRPRHHQGHRRNPLLHRRLHRPPRPHHHRRHHHHPQLLTGHL